MATRKKYKVTAVVEQFPQKGGWIYVRVPQTYKSLGIPVPKWGLVPARFTLGRTVWQKSLLPYGDGTLFVPLNAKVRQAEEIEVGKEVNLSYEVW